MAVSRGVNVPCSLNELAQTLGGEVIGDGSLEISGLRAVDQAGPGDLTFLHQAAYRQRAADSGASAVLVPRALAKIGTQLGKPLLLVADSQLAVAQAIPLFRPITRPSPGIHPTAAIGEGCELGDEVSIGAFVALGNGCRVGDRAIIEAHAVVGDNCRLGEDVWLHPSVVIYHGCEIGDRVEIHSGAVIGADGFGYASSGGVHHKVPQVGSVIIEADVEIGANTAIDRAMLEATRIGAGSKIDNLVQVGHNVELGKACIICGQVGLAGSSILHDYVVMGGQSGATGHFAVAQGTQAAAQTLITKETTAGSQMAGTPATEISSWRRQAVMVPRLPELAKRIRSLEKELARLQSDLRDDPASDESDHKDGR